MTARDDIKARRRRRKRQESWEARWSFLGRAATIGSPWWAAIVAGPTGAWATGRLRRLVRFCLAWVPPDSALARRLETDPIVFR